MRALLVILLLSIPSIVAAKPAAKFASALTGFSSEAELQAYVESLLDGSIGDGKVSTGYGGMSPAIVGTLGDSGNATVTNNQEQGVDEGGIVKNIGDSLVILRQGRLYAVDVKTKGQAKLTDSMRVARDESLNQNVWYDELLVHEDMIYVVGYRYATRVVDAKGTDISSEISGATEFSSFRLNKGKLARLKSTFFESNDYYSEENYTSRMLNGRLIAFMPLFLHESEALGLFPRRLTYTPPKDQETEGTFQVGEAILRWQDIVRSAEPRGWGGLQTVLSCALPKDGGLDCKARAILDENPAQYYVSSDYVFLWGESRVVAFDIKTLQVAEHRIEGHVDDQFAFSEKAGVLRVAAYTDEGSLRILRLPIAKFANHNNQAISSVSLDPDLVYPQQQRWVDDWYLTGLDGGVDGPALLGFDDSTGNLQRIRIPGFIQKLEAMAGVGALIVVDTEQGISMATVKLDGAMELIPSYDFEGAMVSEWRSHGFFFQPNEKGGVFGLPVVQEHADEYWGDGPSSVAFFGVEPSGLISKAGRIVTSQASTGECETSCVDWYGNTRPIFLGGRIFALMGSEISEASIASRPADPKDPKSKVEQHLTEHGKRVNLTFKNQN